MATLVLTAVGSIFGPVGAAIGALAGQAIDAEIFKPAGRTGPRIADLRVQTSSFGTTIPQIFGAMRVAGTVIWSTDLTESAQTSGGGKGKPSLTTYDYAASFAVALSSRRILDIGRIWADGNLLRGSAGDFKAAIGAFRVYRGDADQPIDPMIAADHGLDETPAHRGLAYVVFEGLQLADFGNRIPSLTFEIFADDGPVGVEAIAAALAGAADMSFSGSGETPAVAGYAASGTNAGEALQPLLEAHALLMGSAGDALTLTDGRPVDRLLAIRDDVHRAGRKAVAVRESERKPVETVPRRLSVRHYDPERDYQAGSQSAERQGAGWEEAQVDLPAALDVTTARRRAGDLMRRRMLGRRGAVLARGWDALALKPGDVVALDGMSGGWRVETLEWEAMAVRVGLGAVPVRPLYAPGGDGGSGVHQPDRPLGRSHMALVETPQLSGSAVDAPQVFVAACGEGRGWRGAAVLLREEDGGYSSLGSLRRPAVLGRTLSVLVDGSAALFDREASVEVQVHDGEALLAPVSDAALLAGANACLIGEELVQFGAVERTGARSFRLRTLLRGRRGTERWMRGHGVGETVLLLGGEAMLPVGGVERGGRIDVAAQGVGDATPVHAGRMVDGRAMLPLSPVHLRATDVGAGVLEVRWMRRSRLGWAWVDGADAPLGEEREAYRVEIRAGAVLLRSERVSGASWTYPAGARAIDAVAADGHPVTLSVRQEGTHGLGAPASMTMPP